MSPHDSDGRVRAVIESPRGSRNKLKYEPGLDVFVLDHVLPVGLEFPLDYGFIPGTRGQDGDPIDVLVLMDAPVVPGCAVPVRLVAVIEAEQADDPDRWFRNDRLIGIAHASDSLANVQDLDDLEPILLDQIETWFGTYNTLRGRQFRPRARRPASVAKELVKLATTPRRRAAPGARARVSPRSSRESTGTAR